MNRRSIRRFEKKDLDDKLIGVMLHMATLSPSVGNTQEWQFIVVKNNETKRKLSEACLHQHFIAEAPVIIVVCADKEKIGLRYKERGLQFYSIQDTANATMVLMLAATALGLGTCWIGSFNEEEVKKILELPENLRPVSIIPVGYSAERPEPSSRIPFENLTWTDKHGKKYDVSYLFQPGAKEEVKFKPVGNYIQDVLEKYRKKKGKKH
jgi:nitroreductase